MQVAKSQVENNERNKVHGLHFWPTPSFNAPTATLSLLTLLFNVNVGHSISE